MSIYQSTSDVGTTVYLIPHNHLSICPPVVIHLIRTTIMRGLRYVRPLDFLLAFSPLIIPCQPCSIAQSFCLIPQPIFLHVPITASLWVLAGRFAWVISRKVYILNHVCQFRHLHFKQRNIMHRGHLFNPNARPIIPSMNGLKSKWIPINVRQESS